MVTCMHWGSKLSTGWPRQVQRKRKVPSCLGRRPTNDPVETFLCTSSHAVKLAPHPSQSIHKPTPSIACGAVPPGLLERAVLMAAGVTRSTSFVG